MVDELIELAVAASADVAIDKTSKHHRWVRIVRGIIGLLFIAFVIILIYVTIKYS